MARQNRLEQVERAVAAHCQQQLPLGVENLEIADVEQVSAALRTCGPCIDVRLFVGHNCNAILCVRSNLRKFTLAKNCACQVDCASCI